MISLGDAILTIGANATALQTALDDAQNSIGTKLSQASTVAGTVMTAAGATITASLAGAVFKSVEYGSSILDAAAKTQTSTSAFSELQHAVEQSGGSAENLSKGLLNLTKGVQDAQAGTGPFAESLNTLGINVENLKGMSPDQIFMLLGDAIAGVNDPILQSNLAMDLFGQKCGPSLLPLLQTGTAGIQELRNEAQELGISLSTEQASALESFGDSWANISKSMEGVAIQIGTALMPILQDLVDALIPTISSITDWMKANPELTGTIIMVTGAIGGIMTVLGPILIALPGLVTAIGLVGGAMSALAPIAAVAFGPIGIAVAAAVAAGYLLWDNWEAISQGLSDIWTWLADTASWAWEGITGAFQAGWEYVKSLWPDIQSVLSFLSNPVGGVIELATDTLLGNAEIPGFAKGGVVPGGLTLVGERGPELVNLPRGSRVFNNSDSQGMLGGNNTTYAPTLNISINNASNLSADDIARRIGIEVDKAMRK